MASSSAGAVRTPLESVFSYIPPTHEKGVKQALFNVAALAGVITVSAIGLATYAVFQPFVKPLLWALLLGTVTHPVKRRLTAAARRWLADLERSGSPLFLHALLAPLWAFDAATDAIGDAAVRHIRALAAFVVAIAVVNVVWFYTPSVLLALLWIVSHGVVGNLLWLLTSIFYNKLLCWTLLAGYVLAVAFFWSPATRRFAVPCWLLLLGFLSGLAGSLAGPIFVGLVALMAVGFVTEVLARRREQQDEGINVSMSKTIMAIMCDECISRDQSSVEAVAAEPEAAPAAPAGLLSPGEDESPGSMPSSIAQSPADAEATPSGVETTPTAASSSRAAAYLAQKGMTSTPLSRARPRTLQQAAESEGPAEDSVPGPARGSSVQTVSGPAESPTIRPQQRPQSGERPSAPDPSSGHSPTTTYITAVAYCCLVVVVWQRIWLLSMLPIVIVYYFFKRIVINFWQSGGQDSLITALQPALAWLQERREGIMPLPVRGVWKLILRGNGHVIAGVQGSVDAVVTVLVMLGALFFVSFAAVFAAVQIYGETVHMIEMAGSVFNQTVLANPDLQAMMPANMSTMVEQMIDNGYLYGKDYISKLVRDLTKGAGAQSQEQLERETVELWTRLYQAWVSSVVAAPAVGPVVDGTGLAYAWQTWLEKVQSYPDLLTVDAVKAAVQDNLDTVLSVLDSSWVILRSNVTMLVSVVTQLISVLLGGGFAVLNSLLNLIVFMTALFYLLSSSGQLYKPVELITKLGPVSRGSSRFVMAVDEAVSSVFVASFKMAVFYLLWTWLVHSVFAVKFVYLPSVVAAVLGAVPFLGSYWAALPAVLELWLVHSQPLTALLFFAAQLAPILFVDTAIYSEVKGGHPYLTGLAIAGGIFWLGIEGAIFGPVLLCCLLVAVNMYSSLVNTPDQESKLFAGRLKRTSN
ncbi:Transmembrane protein 245 [Amphibalanus amphitrite]|uniref:Transmembrane protein 245 n=1 Tax=Amphibalanus amphitrite TaxID=1232801 RepID=A0A6A4WC94_AMPAM|nr:transmembrane protein 245-like isoform X3 [Amphibalanus amphitrite]XP_043225474.1 transmembrane protein 245-like isoform X3 [Amphibalanus amphitrite]KAF0304956.1 Transmembrane protein 245 [Amphibalanus amphitrite]